MSDTCGFPSCGRRARFKSQPKNNTEKRKKAPSSHLPQRACQATVSISHGDQHSQLSRRRFSACDLRVLSRRRFSACEALLVVSEASPLFVLISAHWCGQQLQLCWCWWCRGWWCQKPRFLDPTPATSAARPTSTHRTTSISPASRSAPSRHLPDWV